MKLEDIKFRGIPTKAKKYGFIDGDLIRTSEGRYFIFPDGFDLNLTNLVEGVAVYSGFGLLVEVKPETIGQFTGFYDANGNEIFEGDIVKSARADEAIPLQVVRRESGCWKLCRDGICEWDAFTPADPSTNYIVIGNIYQNPELLDNRRLWYAKKKSNSQKV